MHGAWEHYGQYDGSLDDSTFGQLDHSNSALDQRVTFFGFQLNSPTQSRYYSNTVVR